MLLKFKKILYHLRALHIPYFVGGNLYMTKDQSYLKKIIINYCNKN